MKLRLNSLAARLIATAAIWTLLGLVLGGLVLSAAFRSAAQSSFDAALRTDLDGLAVAASFDPELGMALEQRFLNASFARVYSGLYFQIEPEIAGQSPVQTSRSLFGAHITPHITSRQGALSWGDAAGPDNQHLRLVQQRIEFPDTTTPQPDDTRAFKVTVAGDSAAVDAQVARFNGTLIWSFLLLGVGLVVAVFLQVRIGLLPLRRVATALSRIRDGSAQSLEGDFPAEIAPLAGELNSLIAHSAEVVARARTHVSNLAHFLKTPLSVLASEAEASGPSPLAEQVRRQVFTMRRQVDHYLTRARAAGNVSALGNRTQVAPVLSDLTRVLSRIHAARGIEIESECPPGLFFRGERQDLEEMTGNLIDNACKWARHLVTVTARRDGAMLVLEIADDGPGLTPEERARVGTRGERLDESVPGSGLGLAIVRDISRLYGGFFALDEAPAGGLLARLTLPAIG
ncbi:MAG: sensor histidine kinase [Alphaproteobacteria bacterium]|nr:sensor histidine kinase [Alphaproteobacteria bacterium]